MKYKTILADPPWDYREICDYGFRGAVPHYPVMTVAEISQLNVRAVAAANCILWLWGTVPMVKGMIQVGNNWGFDYRIMIAWFKDKLSMGSWFRHSWEICSVWILGKPTPFHSQLRNAFVGTVRSHSEKPEEFFSYYERYMEPPRLEMFARVARPGWDVWGNEVESFVEIPTVPLDKLL